MLYIFEFKPIIFLLKKIKGYWYLPSPIWCLENTRRQLNPAKHGDTNMIFQASEDSFRYSFRISNSIATRWPRVASSFTLDLFRGRKLASGSIVLLEFPAFQFVFQTWAKSDAGN